MIADEDERRLAVLADACQAELEAAEVVLDGIADEARSEARRCGDDSEPLLGLIDEVRRLSRR